MDTPQTSKLPFFARAETYPDARWLSGRQQEGKSTAASYERTLAGQKSTLVANRPELLLAPEKHPSLRNHFLSDPPHPLPGSLLPPAIQNNQATDL